MNYRVVWRKQIADQIHTAGFLMRERGRDPAPLFQAIRDIDSRLGSNPHHAGESRDGEERVLITHPLTVRYEVFESEKVVVIYETILYPRRKF